MSDAHSTCRSQLESDFVNISEFDGGIVVRVQTKLPPLLGLLVYAQEASKVIERMLRRAVSSGARATGDRGVIFPIEQRQAARDLTWMLRQRLEKIADKPIDRKHVEQVLGISGAECNRWTKDGRLPKSGQLIIQRWDRQQLQCSMYATAAIAKLAAGPEVIDRWRHEDLLKSSER